MEYEKQLRLEMEIREANEDNARIVARAQEDRHQLLTDIEKVINEEKDKKRLLNVIQTLIICFINL